MLVTTLLGGVSAFAAVPAAGAVPFVACANSPGFTCATVPVPLDRSGHTPGTVSLGVERKLAGRTPSATAVLALAGGPGQAALPVAKFIAEAISPALGTRDLLVFDQRGTGSSDPLSCPALVGAGEGEQVHSPAELAERCALQLGPARGDFTSEESVGDIEAIRQAAGYEKLVLYGTSYGTKVALQYAERYPQHVAALVLDSVVTASGKEPFAIPSLQAISSVLTELCSGDACAGITSNPVGDLARLAARLRKHALRGTVFDGAGQRHTATLSEVGLLGILEAGDLNPTLRAPLPAAVQSALHSDPQPLLRLELLAAGLIPSEPTTAPSEVSEQIDETLFLDTSCEETPFPWQRAASPAARLAEAVTFLRAQPGGDFYPFDASTAFSSSLVSVCAGWPDASPGPPSPSALPDVPTLILSGAQDLRTPTSSARQVAALIPDAQLEVVPFTGHSVIGSDFSGCAKLAVTTFFASAPVQPCAATADTFAPTPIAPANLANLHPPNGLAGKPGRTLTATLDTLVDLNRQVIAATIEVGGELPSGSRFGGLRGGYARLTGSAVTVKSLSFVPGVELTGTFPVKRGKLQTSTIRISGADASPGTVRIGSGSRVSGTLAGRRFDVSIANARLSRAPGTGPWPARPVTLPLPGLIEEQSAHVG